MTILLSMTVTASSLELAPGLMGERNERRERFLNLKQVNQNQPRLARLTDWLDGVGREERVGQIERDREIRGRGWRES